jgi:TPR repeat protein
MMELISPVLVDLVYVFALLLAILLSGCSQHTVTPGPGFEAGVAAYGRGDYETALKALQPLAEAGNPAAQSDLGVMYEKGQAVPQDYKEAARWYRKAADQGYPTAQFNLARMYGLGHGVPRDYVYAYMWLSLAAADGNKFEVARKTRDALEKHMTRSQVEKAKRLAKEWKPKKNK